MVASLMKGEVMEAQWGKEKRYCGETGRLTICVTPLAPPVPPSLPPSAVVERQLTRNRFATCWCSHSWMGRQEKCRSTILFLFQIFKSLLRSLLGL